MKLIEKLEKLLGQRGWKQNAFERAASLPENRISKWKGKGEPTLSQAYRMARLLEVPLEYLADDRLDDPSMPAGIPDDAKAVLKVYLAFKPRGLTEEEAIRRLAAPVDGGAGQPTGGEVGRVEWRGPVRDRGAIAAWEAEQAARRSELEPGPEPAVSELDRGPAARVKGRGR